MSKGNPEKPPRLPRLLQSWILPHTPVRASALWSPVAPRSKLKWTGTLAIVAPPLTGRHWSVETLYRSYVRYPLACQTQGDHRYAGSARVLTSPTATPRCPSWELNGEFKRP